MSWIFGFGIAVFVVPGLYSQVAKTKFSCDGRTSGYYADVDSGCQVYHMCDGLGRQFSYTCPNATLFQQRMLICDHWYMVNCSRSVADYTANLRIGQREMPFVDDSESNPYHRTPRPDLLHPSQSEYDIIYRTGKAYLGNNLNLVGVESDSKNKTTSTTDEPAYSLPSHWSTEYSQQYTTSKPIVREKPTNSVNSKKILENIIKGKPINAAVNSVTDSPAVNYKSYYKNTTPVFPKTVEINTEAPDDVGLLPPLPYQLQNNNTIKETLPEKTTTEFTVNFKSNFKATTPVYPKVVEFSTQASTVNFKSEFKATTPVYPKSVELTSEEPGDLGILPPLSPNSTDGKVSNDAVKTVVPSLNLEFEPPAVDFNVPINRSQENIEIVSPSKFYQPPKFAPDYTEDTSHHQVKAGGFKSLSNDEWDDLRKKFLIPDYEFPLETVSRPSYDSALSSFQVSPGSLSDEKK